MPTARELCLLRPVFLDTETTGLGSNDQIVEIAVLDFDDHVLLDTLVRPYVPISPQAMAIHGITAADAGGGMAFREVWRKLTPILAKYPVVIYNASFDLRLLQQTASASGVRYQAPRAVHCAMGLYAALHGKASLEKAARNQGVTLPPALHRAAADAELTRRLVRHLGR